MPAIHRLRDHPIAKSYKQSPRVVVRAVELNERFGVLPVGAALLAARKK